MNNECDPKTKRLKQQTLIGYLCGGFLSLFLKALLMKSYFISVTININIDNQYFYKGNHTY